jgi:hypothetical protein
MKFAVLFVTMISSMLRVFSLPATIIHKSFISPAPQGIEARDVEKSVNGTVLSVASASAQYWVCVTVSPSTLLYGWAQASTSSDALYAATAICGVTDCNEYLCQEEGCVGLDFGSGLFELASAYGYGQNDASTAANFAYSKCTANTVNCGSPSYFCSEFVY